MKIIKQSMYIVTDKYIIGRKNISEEYCEGYHYFWYENKGHWTKQIILWENNFFPIFGISGRKYLEENREKNIKVKILSYINHISKKK